MHLGRRGGYRARRYVTPGEVPVWVSSGRWGPRRARVEQCAAILGAEFVYGHLICGGKSFGPGDRLVLTWSPPDGSGRSWQISAEVLLNTVWRRGRLFFRCPRCERRATRLYVPVIDLDPRCRRCWGLSYASQSWSYKATGFLRFLGPIAFATTLERRKQRLEAAHRRYAERRCFLAADAR
jgi:hypothetical protein